jgi:hypothetical protein
MDTAPMTELEAVNIILKADGEQPVNALPASEFSPAGLAQERLRETSREVQEDGWAFNVDLERVFQPDVDDEIDLPANTLWIRPAGYSKHRRLVERGRQLYDLETNSYEFTDSDIYLDVCLFLDWIELPSYARDYIAAKAARGYQQDNTGDEGADRRLYERETRAEARFRKADRKVRRRNMLETPGMANVLRRSP